MSQVEVTRARPPAKIAAPSYLVVERATRILSLFLYVLSRAAMVVLFLLVIVAVIMRYVFSRPITFAEDLGGALTVIVVFGGVSEVFRLREHLRVSIVTDTLRPRVRKAVAALVGAIAAGYVGIWTWHIAKLTIDTYSLQLRFSTFRSLPIWPMNAVMLVGMFTLTLLLCLYCAKQVLALASGRSNEESD